MIERFLRTANGFAEASELDRDDVAAMTFEERISEVERLRRIWFGEDRAESRLDRVLECVDLHRVRFVIVGPRGRRSRGTATHGRPRRIR
jgi:hypothetical protein